MKIADDLGNSTTGWGVTTPRCANGASGEDCCKTAAKSESHGPRASYAWQCGRQI